ncbi:DUF421 domain-containing protein [Rossellomorea sp. YZS02]|uniref:DUF421 domain-containing protein n=1 Tax=Rossellomorea sp. YZS02 TaxID=3097358 RepID=UPI002A1659E0|nr:DUF421 domain-containing protein [Rossellomorea sp. YZS02]MDX8343578.1 DUF421 domain-containing protein [Rossellomorea sp. YZS02]
MEGVLISILRTLLSFILLILVTLIIGKHINSHKTHYSFALSITIGSLIANMGFNTHLHFTEMFGSFMALVISFYLLLITTSQSRRVRRWISGTPTVMIEKGKVLEHNMKKMKFTLDDLNQQMREKGVFDISEVEYALLEVSGQISVKKKDSFQHVTKMDLQLSDPTSTPLPIELIMNGKIIKKNLTPKFSEAWLNKECRYRGLSLREIYYGVVSSDGTLFIDLFHDHIHSPIDIE